MKFGLELSLPTNQKMVISRILYADDDAVDCEVMGLWLRRFNEKYDVTATTSPENAKRLISEQPFDLYIFDYSNEEIESFDLCGSARRENPNSKILIYSSKAFQGDRNNGLTAKVDRFLIKPKDFDKFLPAVRQLLGGRPPSQP